MAIVPLNIFTLHGTLDQKEAVLEGLQRLGCAHLISLTPGKSKGKPGRGCARETCQALRYLQTCPTESQQATNSAEFDFASVEREALLIQQRSQALTDERDYLTTAIGATRPWGEFHIPLVERNNSLRFWFYVVPRQQMEKVQSSDLVWQVVTHDDRFDYVVVVQKDEPPEMPVEAESLDPRPLSQLIRRQREIELELRQLHQRRAELARWASLMAQKMAEADDQASRQHAASQTWDDTELFAVQAWAPRRTIVRFERFAHEHGLAITTDEPLPDESPPTLLENPEVLAGGESTVTFYMTPAYRTWDPSLVVFFSFAIFFAMIFSDAGYALVLGGILAVMWRKLGNNRSAIRMRNLFLALVVASLIWGVMVGSYFGVTPPAGSALASLTVFDVKDQGGMMRVSIIVGVIHLIVANLVTAWRYRRSFRLLAPLGWVAIILGGLIAGLNLVGGTSSEMTGPMGLILLGGGGGAVLFFSSDRPFSVGIRAWGMRLLDGAMQLTGISKAFGDVLSYLRLFALGLASSQLAATFNEIAGTTAKSRGIGVLLAILILVVGHGLNFVLAVIGGVVHGLRLNCIEFFNWSLPEEGYAFEAFSKKATQ